MGSNTTTPTPLFNDTPSRTMKEAHVASDSSVSIKDVPIPTLQQPTEILVKVVASGVNPKDWKMPAGVLTTISECPNSGDDVAGIVEAVGSAVRGFVKGDRVAGLHELGQRGGSFAEYAIVEDHATFHIPDDMAFEQAATLPMASLMAAIGFFGMLKVAHGPWSVVEEPTPLVVYGASSAIGVTIVQFANMVNVHPLICVVGHGADLVEPLLQKDKGDVTVDYRQGNEAVVEGIRAALKGQKLLHAFDAVSAHGSWQNIGQVLDPNEGEITLVLPGTRDDLPGGVHQTCTMAGSIFKDLKFQKDGVQGDLGFKGRGREFGTAFSRLIGKWVADGSLRNYPYQVEAGGLAGLEGALKSLRQGKTSGFKHVLRIADTPGIHK